MPTEPKTLGQIIKERRETLGWTLHELAVRSGIPGGGHIYRIESGDVKDPRYGTVTRLLDALGIDDQGRPIQPEPVPVPQNAG